MDAISKQVNNPEWWFTVVIVGLIIGVVAAYAKDWLSSILSTISKRYRIYAEKNNKNRELELKLLVDDPRLLAIEYIRLLLVLTATISLLAAAYILTAWSILKAHFPEIDPVSAMINAEKLTGIQFSQATQIVITQTICLIPALFLWFHFMNRYIFCEEARHRLHK